MLNNKYIFKLLIYFCFLIKIMSGTAYLDRWSNYGKKEKQWEDYTPRLPDDIRKRVRRETVRGKSTYFHDNIEEYIVRQLKANTAQRVFVVWLTSVAATAKSMF